MKAVSKALDVLGLIAGARSRPRRTSGRGCGRLGYQRLVDMAQPAMTALRDPCRERVGLPFTMVAGAPDREDVRFQARP